MIKASAFLLAMSVVLALPSTNYAQSSSVAERPRVFLDTTYTPSTRQPWIVAAGGDLQSVLHQAQPGDVISLQAGATFTGNYILPVKSGSEYITIRTSTPDSQLPPPGTRITPSHAGLLAKIVTANVMPALRTEGAAHHYRFIGLEFAIDPQAPFNYSIIDFGDSGSSQSSLAQVPQNLIVDRCYIHGNTTKDAIRGISINSGRTAIIDSYISNIHAVGFDNQAICVWNGPGPFKIVNNFLEAAGENVMFGGADTSIADLTPADIEIRRNHFYKRLSWNLHHPSFVDVDPVQSGTQHWTVKNLLELKHARRVLVEENMFENHWVEAQTGAFLLLTPRNQGGSNPWAVVEDITIQKNWIKNVSGGFDIAGYDDLSPSRPTARVLIKNNILDGIGGGTTEGDGRMFQLISGTDDLIIEHNTVINSGGTVVVADVPSQPHPRFTFRNNLTPHNQYGIFGSGVGVGGPALETYFPGAVFARNAMYGPLGTWIDYIAYSGNTFANGTSGDGAPPVARDAASIGFEDLAGRNLRLRSDSAFKNRATDGTDMGVQDAAGVKTATELAVSGNNTGGGGGGGGDTTAPTISSIVAGSLTSTSASISWNTNEPSDTQIEWGLTTSYGNSTAVNLALVTAHAQTVSGLAADTLYHYRVKSRDAAGNLATSADATFRTAVTPPSGGSGTGLTAQYYNDPSTGARLTTLALTRTDATVNFTWGAASPAPGVQSGNFSVRWSGQVQAPVTGSYTFSTVSDDGVRLWVNGQLRIDNWTNHAATTNTAAPITLTAGVKYDVKMEFYDATYDAVAKLLWSYPGQAQQIVPQAQLYPTTGGPPSGPAGLKGQYFNNTDLTALALTRTDATVNFNWGGGTPAAAIGSDTFSVRWTGKVTPRYSEVYTFTTTTDDGARLWVNGQLLVDRWINQGVTSVSGVTAVALQAGVQYDIRLEYYDNVGHASAKLEWSSQRQAREVVPADRLAPAP
jgi:hypothetical protein